MLRNVNLDMDLLRTFVTGVQIGNFSQAADRVGRSQSAVSLQLRRLEQQMGGRLFDKQGRGLVLNNKGETLYRYAQRILELNDEAVAAVRHQEVAGEIRLGIPPDLAETWLPKMLGRFARMHPEVLIEARVDRNRNLFDDLASNALDIAIVWGGGSPSDPSGGTNIVELPVSWIGTRDMSLAGSSALPLVLMGAPCLFRQRALEALEAAGRPWRVAFTSSSLAGVWAAVAAGLGVTVRTAMGMPPELRALPPPGPAQEAPVPDLAPVGLRAHITGTPTEAARRFFAILLETMTEELGRAR